VPTTAILPSSVIPTLPAAQPGTKLVSAPDAHEKAGQGPSFSQLFAEHALPLEREQQVGAGNLSEGKQQGELAVAQSPAQLLPELNKPAPMTGEAQPVSVLKFGRAIGNQISSEMETALPQFENVQRPVKGEAKEDLADSSSMSAQKSEKKQSAHSSQVVNSSSGSNLLQQDTAITPQKDEKSSEGVSGIPIQVPVSMALQASPVQAAVVSAVARPVISVSEPGLPIQSSASAGKPLQLAGAAQDFVPILPALSQVGGGSDRPATVTATGKQAAPDEPASNQPPMLEGIPVAQPVQGAQEASLSESSTPVSELSKALKDTSGNTRSGDAKSSIHISSQIPIQAPSTAALLHGNQDGDRSVAASNVPEGSQLAGVNRFGRDGGVVAGRDVNPYQHLDQASEPVVLRADTGRVTVGVHDTSLGWVEIKAQGSAGQVSASLVAASSQTHASLTSQLPGLTQFLSERHVRIDHLGVEQHLQGSREQNGRQETDRQASQGSSDGTENAEQAKSSDAASSPAPSLGRVASGETAFSDGVPLSYISVRA
jgi:hypothetical protein